MQRSFKYLLFVGWVLLCTSPILAQSKPTYKDVLLNGKPAKLNMATGEFILVSGKKLDTITPIELSSKTESSILNDDNTASKVKETKGVLRATVSENNIPTFHIVKAGETLFGLSKKYGVTLHKLKAANNLETTLISVGQKLRVADFEKSENETNVIETVIVTKGNTLYGISKKYGITVDQLKQLNNLKSNTIFIGQELRIK